MNSSKNKKDLKTLHQKVLNRLIRYDITRFDYMLRAVRDGALRDIQNTATAGTTLYYKYLPCLIDEIKPRQVVELGSAAGCAVLMMLTSSFKNFTLYTCTLAEPEGQWRYIVDEYPNIVKVLGNDLDLSVWPKTSDLSKTDLWFIDSEHTPKQLRVELNLYKPYFKKGAIILLDDIHSFGLEEVWQEIKYKKLDVSELHYSGFGIVLI